MGDPPSLRHKWVCGLQGILGPTLGNPLILDVPVEKQETSGISKPTYPRNALDA